jgi:hypothetical protein
MSGLSRSTRLPRLLFGLTVAASAVLFLLVFLCPLLDNGQEQPHGWARLVAVFARDTALRRTALASAVGLLVTACVFFQPTGPSRPARRGPRPPKPPPPVNMAGA